MRVISIQSLLCCFMFLLHGTHEIECRCKKKRLCYQRNTGGSFGTVEFHSCAHSGRRTRPFTTLIPNTTAEQQAKILQIKRPKPPLRHTQTSPHLIRIKGRCWEQEDLFMSVGGAAVRGGREGPSRLNHWGSLSGITAANPHCQEQLWTKGSSKDL